MTKRKGAEQRQQRPAVCVGCGEAAAGYNYDAPSCFSCKAFFRRVVVSKRLFKGCLKGGLCATEGGLCRACRFEMCLNGGMNASLVTNNKHEPEENTAFFADEPSSSNSADESMPLKLNIKEEQSSLSSSTSSSQMQIVENPSRFECKVDVMIQNLLSIEAAHQLLRISSYTPKMLGELSMDDFLDGPSKLGTNFEVMCPQPYTPYTSPIYPLEVIVKNRVHMDFTNFDYSANKLWFFHDVVYSVEYLKALPVYHLLETNSKKVLLSSALTCSNFTAAFYSYFNRSDRTFFPDGSTLTWDSKMQEQAPLSTRRHTAIIAVMKEADINSHEYALLKMIVVCNPLLVGLSSADATLLRLERERCAKSLLSYVLSRRGVDKGPAFFMKILAIANVLMQLTSWEKSQHILATALGLYKNPTAFSEAIFNST